MKRLRLYVRAFFGFSRMETNGFLILMPLVLVVLFSERVYNHVVDTVPLTGLDRTDSLLAWLEQQKEAARKSADTIVFHSFDPNAAPLEELIALGLPARTAERLIRYREKGGRFRRKEDVAGIYGMDSAWFGKAAAWMIFPKKEYTKQTYAAKQKVMPREDINTADTLRLQDVYGIGPILARRIVNFRERLGGFVSMHQLTEVFGLDSLVIIRVMRQFEVRPGYEPRKINLREATVEELSRHPYMSRRQAQAIVAYRSQHSLESLEQLKALPLLDDRWFSKMQPYVRIAPLPP
jgi:competence protein ComEA